MADEVEEKTEPQAETQVETEGHGLDILPENDRLSDEPEPEPEPAVAKEDAAEEGKETPKPGDIKYTKKVEEKIGKLTRQKHEMERDRDYWKSRASETPPVAPENQAQPASEFSEAEPQEETFETTAGYIKALSSWQYKKDRSTENVKLQTENNERLQKTRWDRFNERVDSSGIREKNPEFDDLIAKHGKYSPSMTELVLESDIGPELALYFANNPEKSEKIATMTPLEAARQIGKLEMVLSAKPDKKTITNAPPPITPVTGNDTPRIKIHDKMSQREYEKARGLAR